ncbi:cupin domain-containing protein [Maricaulis sp. CAU 1757]
MMLLTLAGLMLAVTDPGAGHDHPPVIVPPGEGEAVGVPFHPVDKLLSEEDNADGLAFYEFRVPPQSAGAPPHTHTHEDEFFYVVSGTVSFLNGEEVVAGGPGTFAAMTRGHAHAFWNAGEDEAVMLVGVSAGEFETFFDAVAAEVAAAPPAGPEEMGALVGRLAAERGIEIRMDLLPDEAAELYGMPPR